MAPEMRMKEIEKELASLRETHTQFFSIWNVLDRKKRVIETKIIHLENELKQLSQGQLRFDSTDF